MDSRQCKMARVAFGVSAHELAEKSGIGYATIARFESGAKISDDSRDKLRTTLEEMGAQFTLKTKRIGVNVPE